MPAKAVVDAVEARIGATWSGIPVRGVNVGSDVPDDATTFIVVEYPVASVERLGLSKLYREEGAFRLVLNTERGAGLGQTLTWADQLSELFRDQWFGGIRTEEPEPATVDDSNDRGGFFQVSVAVPYSYNFREV